jgi:hypothetical protein
MKIKKNLILLLILILAIALINVFVSQNNENFENEIVISNLSKNAGFYSELFFLLNHYLYCKDNKINFKINSDNWLFKYKDGWTDYFEPIELKFYENLKEKNVYHKDILTEFTINDYKEAINDVYKYNDFTKTNIEKTIENLNLKNKQYSSIFIRRGDKLASESIIINEDEYLKILLDKNPNCNHLFVQTDDYNSVINLQKLIDEKKINIKIYTLCPIEQYGTIVLNREKNNLLNACSENETNKKYLSENINKMTNNKSVEDMNNEEIKQHTLDMIIGIDIVKNSDYCILDYQSNVSRFIKLFHNNPNNVINIMDVNNDIDYNKKICPGNGF